MRSRMRFFFPQPSFFCKMFLCCRCYHHQSCLQALQSTSLLQSVTQSCLSVSFPTFCLVSLKTGWPDFSRPLLKYLFQPRLIPLPSLPVLLQWLICFSQYVMTLSPSFLLPFLLFQLDPQSRVVAPEMFLTIL
jgi:hypothetical protein